MTLTVVEKCF